MWAIERYGVEPDLLVSGKSLGGGLPLAAVTGRAELMDARRAGGLGGTFGGNPVACAAALAVLDEVAAPAFRARAEALGGRIRAASRRSRGRTSTSARCAALGPMLALELVESRETRRAGGASSPPAIVAARLRPRPVLLSCGLDGNVIRILVPLVVDGRRSSTAGSRPRGVA